MTSWAVMKMLFIDGQLLAAIVTGLAFAFLFYWFNKKDKHNLQETIWKKEFDMHQTDPIITIFRGILLTLNRNEVSSIKSGIPQITLDDLRVEIHLVRYFDAKLRNRILEKIYKECLYYNNIGIVSSSKAVSSTDEETDIVVNESKVEKDKRKKLIKEILDVVDEIKKSYAKK